MDGSIPIVVFNLKWKWVEGDKWIFFRIFHLIVCILRTIRFYIYVPFKNRSLHSIHQHFSFLFIIYLFLLIPQHIMYKYCFQMMAPYNIDMFHSLQIVSLHLFPSDIIVEIQIFMTRSAIFVRSSTYGKKF